MKLLIANCELRIANWVPRPWSCRGREFSIFNFQFSILALSCVAVLVTASGCAHRQPQPPIAAQEIKPAQPGTVEKGIASWYGEPYHGRQTASGEIYDMHQLTAAHRTLPFGTVVRVTRRDTGASVKLRINDRGPFIEGRIIDLSFAGAQRIGLDVDGVAPVKVEVLDRKRPVKPGPPPPPPPSAANGGACWWVQVGAFADEDNARRVERKLDKAGEQAILMESPDGLHRVRVGPFSEDDGVDKALKRIRQTYPEARLVSCG